MSNTIITIILSFNVILLVLFFVMKLHNSIVKRASDNLQRFADEEQKGMLVDGDMEKIRHALSDRTIPDAYKNRETVQIETPHCRLTVVRKSVLDKKTNTVGVVVEAKHHKGLLNISPLQLLDNTGEKTFCVRNDNDKLIGFFTPYHVIVVNLETLQCTQTIENDDCENGVEISVTEYTKDGVSVKQQTLKVHPFMDAPEFIAEYYLREFKGAFRHEL